jgi:hypothetical protein
MVIIAYAECHIKAPHNAEFRYAKCRYAECRGAVLTSNGMGFKRVIYGTFVRVQPLGC